MTTLRSDEVTFQTLLRLVPTAPAWVVDWKTIWHLWPQLPLLDTCPQDPVFHAEGDAGIHTRMVVEQLVSQSAWRKLPEDHRSCLFWAAVLHDVGKPVVTKVEEDGRVTSRGHSRVGAAIARQILWKAHVPFTWREQLCGLISAHQLPFWLIERDQAERLAIKTSWECRLDYLCLHARADALGRQCEDLEGLLVNVELAQQVFEDTGCLEVPFPFSNDESRVAYFEKPDRDPHYVAHEDFRCTVTLMSGLPGAGKDTWIGKHCPELPVVSLDALREELGEPATGNQGRVVQAAYEAARDHLRNCRDFVWNATNISAQLRAKPLRLLRDYGARIKIVYLEPPPERLLAQNRDRASSVPFPVLENLLRKLEPPAPWEAHSVVFVTGADCVKA